MANTLFLYQKNSRQDREAAELMSHLTGFAKACAMEEIPEDLSKFETVFFIAGESDFEFELKSSQLCGMKMGIIEVTTGKSSGVVEKIRSLCSKNEDYYYTIDYLHSVQDVALQIAGMLKQPKVKLVDEKLKESIDAFIKDHNMLALTTGSGDFVRCTPIEFQYINDCFYIITEGGLKFKGLSANHNVSMGIYDSYQGMEQLKGLQIMGTQELLDAGSEEYFKIFENRGIKGEALENIPIQMYVIKIKPFLYEFMNSEFKKQGFDSRQKLVLKL